jgi:hypothetical protein
MRYITAQLNHRIEPIDRGDLYEDPLDEMLKAAGLGEVTGGGTAMQESMEIDYVDIEIELSGDDSGPDDPVVQRIIAFLEEAGAPKGSKIINHDGDATVGFGQCEGLGLYLNGSDLPDAVYEAEDINIVLEELNALLEGVSSFDAYWEGSHESALYAYGASFAAIKAIIAPYVAKHPLCQLARIVQIA